MKVAIMQPYFLPYLGYFQLINAVDVFVIYDNIKFTKKGWINRNRILLNGKPHYFTIDLNRSAQNLKINQKQYRRKHQAREQEKAHKVADSGVQHGNPGAR